MEFWHVSEGTATYISDSTNPGSGMYCAKGIEFYEGSLGRLYQDMTGLVSPARQYKISGWIKTQDVVGYVVIALNYVNDYGGTPADGYVKEIGYVTGTTDWAYYESDAFILPPMPSDASALWFLFDFNDGKGTAWWDDVSLIDIATPRIYIRVDGSVDPDTAPIASVDNVTYTLTDNISDSIVVERSDIIIDGAGYTVEGVGSGSGFGFYGVSNVTIKKANIKGFYYGIYFNSACHSLIYENNITSNGFGIKLHGSSNNSIYHNNFINNAVQVWFVAADANFWDDGYPSGGNHWSNISAMEIQVMGHDHTLWTHIIKTSILSKTQTVGYFIK